MFYDATMLARARTEITRELLERRVSQIMQPNRDEVVIVFRADPGRNALLLSSCPQFGRVHLGRIPNGRGQLQPFGMALRKHLRGARLLRLCQPGFDRVLSLQFSECEGFGPESRRELIVEIMGKHSNMVLVGEDGRIISCAKHVPSRLNRYRQILEGEEYIAPPTGGRLDPREVSAEILREWTMADSDSGLTQVIATRLLGMSRVFCAEITARVGAEMVQGLPGETEGFALVVQVIREMILEAESEGPVWVYEPSAGTGLPSCFAYPVSLRCCGPPVSSATHLGDAVVPLVAQEQTAQRQRQLRSRLASLAGRRLEYLEAKLNRLQQQLSEAESAKEFRKTAELLLAQPGAAAAGASHIELVNYYEDDAPTITLKLNRPGDVYGTAQRLFERSKRAARLLRALPRVIRETEEQKRRLTCIMRSLESAESLEELLAVEGKLRNEGFLREPRQEAETRTKDGRKLQARGRTSTDGFLLLHGTSEAENEALLRTAAPNDIWLHARGAPGAHVVIRTNGRPEQVPKRTLVEAAALAASFSRLRDQETVDVDYTLVKRVRRQKGASRGRVYYTHQRTITVRLVAEQSKRPQ